MYVFQLRKILDDFVQAIVEILLCKFDFSHVERANSSDLVLLMHHCWRLSLSFRKCDVDEITRSGDNFDFLEIVG